MRYVISLSSVPPRFDKIGPALASLVGQSIKPLAVDLWIPWSYRRFPDWDGRLPDVPEGVTIRRPEVDYGPATKFLPAAKAWRGQGVELLFCDDDHVFTPNWAAEVQKVRRDQPRAVLCGMTYSVPELHALPPETRPQPRAVLSPPYNHQLGFQLRRLVSNFFPVAPGEPVLRQWHRRFDRAGHGDIVAGCAGVALNPDVLDDPVFDLPPVVWAVDDIWLSGHLERLGVPIWGDPRLNQARVILIVERTAALMHAEIEGADRRAANSACIAHFRQTYGVWGGMADQST